MEHKNIFHTSSLYFLTTEFSLVFTVHWLKWNYTNERIMAGGSHICLFFELIETRQVIKSKLSLQFYRPYFRLQTQRVTYMYVK